MLLVDATGTPVNARAMITVQPMKDSGFGPEVQIEKKALLGYGTYKLTVRASPAYPVDKIITIKERYQPVLVPLFVAPIELPPAENTVGGRIPESSTNRDCRLVRLLSPVSEKDYADAVIGKDGQFAVENVRPGAYLVVTFGPEGVCDVFRTNVLDKRSQTLVLR